MSLDDIWWVNFKDSSKYHAVLIHIGSVEKVCSVKAPLLNSYQSVFFFQQFLDWLCRLVRVSIPVTLPNIMILTSINFSKSLSKLAKSSFRFLLSAMSPCFFFRRPCLADSSASRSASSSSMRAIIKACSSSSASSGFFSRNCSIDMRGSCWYLWLEVNLVDAHWHHCQQRLTRMTRMHRFHL